MYKTMSKYEQLAIGISSFALVISVAHLAIQYWPQADHLKLVDFENVDDAKAQLATSESHQDEEELKFRLAPITWEVVLANPLDRSVSIVTSRLYFRNEAGQTIDVLESDFAAISGGEPSVGTYPFVIPERSAARFRIEAELPVDEPPTGCEAAYGLDDYRRCYAKQGSTDLFGNSIQFVEVDDNLILSWPQGNPQPRLDLELVTADDSMLSYELPYFEGSIVRRSD